jgi:hypothetical protein
MERELYEVTDMYFVATLIAYEADYVGVDRGNKKTQKFFFNNPIGVKEIYIFDHGRIERVVDPTFEQIKIAYDTIKLLLPPRFFDAIRKVKGIIHT